MGGTTGIESGPAGLVAIVRAITTVPGVWLSYQARFQADHYRQSTRLDTSK